MDRIISAPLFAAGWLLGMLAMVELGRLVGIRRLVWDPQKGMDGLDTIAGAVFALFGLMIAFTFSGSASRLEARHHLLGQESNEISTAYQRLALLSPDDQPGMRKLFRAYVDSRISVYRSMPDIDAAKAELRRSENLQNEIWTQAIAITHESRAGAHPDAAKLLLPSLNSMFDISTTRTEAVYIHPPMIIYALLFALGLVCSLLGGCRMAAGRYRSWLHIIGFAFMMGVSVYITINIEYPRLGFIRYEVYDQVLVELRNGMK